MNKNVNDLGAAAYIMMHKYKVYGKKGKSIHFEVEDTDIPKFDTLYRDYLNSEFHRFDSCLMSLKKIDEIDTINCSYKSVSDLGAAAYIMMYKYQVLGKKGRAIYFEVEDADISNFETLYREYLNSEFHRFDSCLMSLKKIDEINNI